MSDRRLTSSTLVTDSGTDEKHINILRESGVQVIVATPPSHQMPENLQVARAEVG